MSHSHYITDNQSYLPARGRDSVDSIQTQGAYVYGSMKRTAVFPPRPLDSCLTEVASEL